MCGEGDTCRWSQWMSDVVVESTCDIVTVWYCMPLIEIVSHSDKGTYRQIDCLMERQADRQMDRQTDGQIVHHVESNPQNGQVAVRYLENTITAVGWMFIISEFQESLFFLFLAFQIRIICYELILSPSRIENHPERREFISWNGFLKRISDFFVHWRLLYLYVDVSYELPSCM